MFARNRSASLGIARRGIHNYLHNPAFLIPSLIFPLFFYTAFAGGLSTLGHAPGFNFRSGYSAFQFAFVLLQSAAFGGVFTGFGMAIDFENGFARRMMLAVPSRWTLVVGYGIAGLVRFLITAALVFSIALATGMRVDGNGVDLFGLVGLAIIANFAGMLFSMGIAMRFRSLQAGPLMQTPVFLVLFLAPVYVPLPLLSGWIHGVATVNPATAVLEGARDLISGSTGHVSVAFVAVIGMALALLVFAARGLRKAEQAGG